ncbi:MAG: type IX secretion system sortase PorU [Candidatus Zixiibacteriota bacterium]
MVRKTRSSIPFYLLLVLASASLTRAAEYDDIAIESQSAAGLTFRYTPASLSWREDTRGVYPYMRATALRDDPVAPTLPGRIVYVALPPNARAADVELLSTTAATSGRHESLAFFETDYPMPFPSDEIIIDDIFWLRGIRLARLILHPMRIIDSDGSYTVAGDMRVRVTYSQPATDTDVARSAPADAFTPILQNLILNADQGMAWRRPESAQSPLAKPAQTPDPFAGADEWIAIHSRDEGIARVTGAQLEGAGVSLSTIDPDQMRLFGGPGTQLSTTMSDPAPQLTERAIRVVDGGDGSFDSQDYFEYYADALNRWAIDEQSYRYDIVNRYARENVYWLALDGGFAGAPKRIVDRVAPSPLESATTINSASVRVRHEQDNLFRVNSLGYVASYYTWYWRNSRSSQLFMTAVEDAMPGTSARVEVGAYTQGALGYSLFVDATQADTVNDPRTRRGEDGTRVITFEVPDFNPGSEFILTFEPGARGEYYLDYYSVEYQRRLNLIAGGIRFVPDVNGAANLVFSNVTSPEVWNITDPSAVERYTGLERDGSVARMAAIDGMLYAVESSRRVTPTRIRVVPHAGLYAPATGADYIAIGPREFASSTADFLAYRESTHGVSTRYVAVEDVYDNFSLGLRDPVAIRRFLRHTFQAWPTPVPAYALLVGDGSYDFLGNVGTLSINHVPPYITADDQSVSDENYVYFGDKKVLDSDPDPEANIVPDMLIGRWPVKTTADIANLTAKVREYESTNDLGPWRSRVIMVADDEFGDRDAGSVSEEFHVEDAEEISQRTIPDWIDIKKIYMTEYPFNNPGCYEPRASGCRKPAVNEAIVNALNEGALVFDYIGHGNPDLLAHERVFQRTEELRELTNSGRATSVLTFSCSIGFFDDPRSEGMAEEWLRMPDAGAVAVVSATRLVTAFANAELNRKVFDLLFSEHVTGIAASLYTAKLLRQYGRTCSVCDEPPCPCENDRRYMLLGDPALQLGEPVNRVQFTSVEPAQFEALARAMVSGEVVDTAGERLTDFNGTVSITVRDAPRQREYRINDLETLQYELPGGTLYRGEVAVRNGQFEFGFVIPKDIAYGETGALIRAHAASTTQMAAGVRSSIPIAGAVGELTDTVGPEISVSDANGEPVFDGYQIAQGGLLKVTFTDSSGINLTGSPGHRIEVFVDNDIEAIADLTDAFEYDAGAFTTGTAEFTLPDIPLGNHRLTIKAWDNANNSSTHDIDLDVAPEGAGTEFRISEFLTYPNPCRGETTFYFLTTRAHREATIRIFTLAGRLIWEQTGVVDGLTRWDGHDADGDPVANGVYIAQLEVTPDGSSVDNRVYEETKIVLSR